VQAVHNVPYAYEINSDHRTAVVGDLRSIPWHARMRFCSSRSTRNVWFGVWTSTWAAFTGLEVRVSRRVSLVSRGKRSVPAKENSFPEI
jgi:hypothetical protein